MFPKDIMAFYDSEIKPLVFAHEDRRILLAKRVKVSSRTIATVTICLVVITFLLSPTPDRARELALFLAVCGLFAILISRSLIPLEDFYRLKLLPDVNHTQKFEDKISGRVNGNDFILHELRLDNGGTDGNWMFEGQILRVACPKAFLGETIVLRKKFDASRKVDETLKKVGLVSKQFEALFNVYSTDQVEARYLLPPDFIQHLIDFENSIEGRNLRFGFADQHLLVSIETEDRFQSSSVFKAIESSEDVQKNIKELKAIVDIIEYLNVK